MGWKNLKEHFNLEDVIVQVKNNQVLIGSGFISDLISFDMETGEKTINPTFPEAADQLPELKNSNPKLILELLTKPDAFTASLPVFTYEGGRVLEYLCEEYGYPNVTHCGRLMYLNQFNENKEQVTLWARENLDAEIRYCSTRIEDLKKELASMKNRMEESSFERNRLDQNLPKKNHKQTF